MNQNLQSVLNLLQQSPALTAEEMESIAKYVRATTILLEETIEELEGKRKAIEAQNRELEIEAALERVRTIAMGMNKAEDMLDVCKTISHQLELLSVKEIRNVQTAIFYKDKGTYMNYEYYAKHNKTFITETTYSNNERHAAFAEQMQKGSGESIELNITDLDEWIAYQKTTNVFIDDFLYNAPSLSYYWYSLGPVALSISTYQPLKETEKELFNRFLKVFELAYRRYLDIEQAEAQAREAKIEAALERVRSIAMGMTKSDDLLSICEAIFVQLSTLGFPGIRSAQIHIRDDEKEEFVNYDYADNLGSNVMRIKYSSHFYVKHLYNAIKDAGDTLVASSRDEKELQEWRAFLYDTLRQPAEEKLDNATELHYYLYSFGKGAIGISSFTSLTNDDLEVLKRFRNVFSFSYQRYSDISLAEEQAREARVEAALERVRSRTLAMQKSDELAETASVLFKQLIGLGIAPNRLYIGIINENSGDIEFWITDEEGSKISTMFTGSAYKNVSTGKMYDGWKQQHRSIVIDMHGQELDDYLQYLGEELHLPFKDGLSQKRRLQHIAFFSKGFISMASPDEQPKETLELLERFASVFNLTFTRFNDLKVAEAHALQAEQDLLEIMAARKKAEDALNELQVTQKQLIQSEKMASLGELTAGIAHEIQNPLNFVNNFSEVSNELIAELEDERKKTKNERDEQLEDEILADIKQNLEKINHHGKRADAIVKGMLQHSRKSEGKKEPTDINALCDEYLRLSYHGLRAKDKAFNAEFKTDFDTGIGKINVVPQDIGRVVLNILTNAFYAVTERKLLPLKGNEEYQPTVTLNTKKTNDKILIMVRDNGNGIPQNIIDKIFQPFFTTKPTGQGTGLGLSLSYDIIKAHGGSINVNSAPGEFTAFIVTLPLA